MYEVNPLSYVMQQAGGLATSNGVNPLDIEPQSLTQRVPIAMGSRDEVKKYLTYL